ncbi:MAG: TetR/AcrR family transcriptional regulator [Rhodothermaceae bacterium]
MSKDEQIKAQIIENASLLFQKWGFHKTTMEDIAKATGKAKSSLYYYYKSKNEIFEDLIESQYMEMLQKINVEVNRCESYSKKLETFLMLSFEEMASRAPLYEIMVNELNEDNKLLKSMIKAISKREVGILEELFNKAIENKEFRYYEKEDLRLIAEQIVRSLRQLQVVIYIEQDKRFNKEKIRIFVDLILNGVKK